MNEIEEHVCIDWDWFAPHIYSDDPDDEVLACVECGRVQWTARSLKSKPSA